jgi:hypothetical protein
MYLDGVDSSKPHLFVIKHTSGCDHACRHSVKTKLTKSAFDKSHYGIIDRDHSLVNISPLNMEALSRVLGNDILDFAPVLPQFKISQNLNNVKSVTCTEEPHVDLHIVLMPVDASDLQELHDLVAEVARKWDPQLALLHPDLLNPSTQENTCTLRTVCANDNIDSIIAAVSSLSFVQWIERRGVMQTYSKWANGVCQSGNEKNKAINNRNLTGVGHVIGIADTGIDPYSCFFYDDTMSFPYDTVDMRHRKVIYYNTFVDYADADSHGTGVSAVAAGKCSEADGNSAYNGGAYNAKIAFFDIGDANGDLDTPSNINSDLFVPLYNAGAMVQSMSWGARSSSYDVDARYIESDVYLYCVY